jgi:hypothetical protein
VFAIGRPKGTTNKPKDRDNIEFRKLSESVYSINYKVDKTQYKYTKDQIQTFLDNNDDIKLREVSNYFFAVSGEYRRLVFYYSSILTFDNLVIPIIKNQEQLDQKNFESGFQKAVNYMDDSNSKQTNRFVSFITVKDGVFYGYERDLEGVIAIQQLPPEFCRSRYKLNGNYAVEFNFKYFDTFRNTEDKIEAFEMFPNEFLQLYNIYRENSQNIKNPEWQLLNPEFARCHKMFDNGTPLLSPVFTELVTLSEYKVLDKAQSEMDLYKLIVQKAPIDSKTNMPIFKLEELQELHGNAKKMITQEGVDVLTTLLDVEAINLQEKGQTIRDNIERASNNVHRTTGTSSILFDSGTKGGSIGLDKSIKVDESMMFTLLDQFKTWYEVKLNVYLISSRNYNFEVLFPEITIFNRKEMFEIYKTGATLGYSKLLPLCAMGIKQTTFMNLLNVEQNIYGLQDKMIPLQTSFVQSGDGGRPESDGTLTPSGEKTKDKQTNKTRAKK